MINEFTVAGAFQKLETKDMRDGSKYSIATFVCDRYPDTAQARMNRNNPNAVPQQDALEVAFFSRECQDIIRQAAPGDIFLVRGHISVYRGNRQGKEYAKHSLQGHEITRLSGGPVAYQNNGTAPQYGQPDQSNGFQSQNTQNSYGSNGQDFGQGSYTPSQPGFGQNEQNGGYYSQPNGGFGQNGGNRNQNNGEYRQNGNYGGNSNGSYDFRR